MKAKEVVSEECLWWLQKFLCKVHTVLSSDTQWPGLGQNPHITCLKDYPKIDASLFTVFGLYGYLNYPQYETSLQDHS